MASQDAASADKDAAARTRIITHMNADHQDSLIRYLQHYCSLPSLTARNAHLTSITFDSLIINSSPKSAHTIPISPLMTSWSEARPRVVVMDAEATAALGKSSITVKRYKKPRGFMTVVFVAVAITFLLFCRRAHFRPGSVVYDVVMRHAPGFADFCWRIQPLLFYTMVVWHGAEVAHMYRSRLEKHTVRMFSGVWWAWVVSAFVEGFGSFWRFDEVVREEEGKKAVAKH